MRTFNFAVNSQGQAIFDGDIPLVEAANMLNAIVREQQLNKSTVEQTENEQV